MSNDSCQQGIVARLTAKSGTNFLLLLLALASTGGVIGCASTQRATSSPPAEVATPKQGHGRTSSKSASPKVHVNRPVPKLHPVRRPGGGLALRRSELRALVNFGAHRFLTLVDVRPAFRERHFIGWQIVAYRGPGRVSPGDIVLQVNRHGLQRPEQFFVAWSTLASGKTLRIDLLRRRRRVIVELPIIDG